MLKGKCPKNKNKGNIRRTEGFEERCRENTAFKLDWSLFFRKLFLQKPVIEPLERSINVYKEWGSFWGVSSLEFQGHNSEKWMPCRLRHGCQGWRQQRTNESSESNEMMRLCFVASYLITYCTSCLEHLPPHPSHVFKMWWVTQHDSHQWSHPQVGQWLTVLLGAQPWLEVEFKRWLTGSMT